jgi:predicted GH43/DUF377 family glycosyl hydrolase
MGFAWSDDGLHFTRGHEPIFHAGPDDEFLGPLRDRNDISISYGDSRLFADESGRFYLFFNFFRARIEKNQQLAVATSTDLKNWKVHGRAFAKQAPLDVEVIPEMSPKRFPHPAVVTQLVGDRFVVKKLDGRYWMYLNVHSTDGSSSFCMATSENMLDWKVVRDAEGRLVHPMSSRSGQFDSGYMDTTAAVRRDDGILLIYNGINAQPGQGGDPRLQRGAHYPAQALFDKDVPFRLLKRSETPFKGGDEELERQPIVFWYAPLYESWSLVPWKGELLLYWNHAFGRRSVGLWKASLPDNL